MVATHAFIAFPRPALQSAMSGKCLRFAASSRMSRGPATVSSFQTQRPLPVRASLEAGERPKSSASAVESPPAKGGPDDGPLQTVYVEDQGVSVEGVAKVDRNEPFGNDPPLGRIAFLAGGDILALLAFAAIGRLSHGMAVVDWDALRTADPFIAGWLLGAYLLGGYGPNGQGANGFANAIFAAVKSWAVGIPLGLVIRGVTSGHAPAQPFVVVSMASTLVLLVGWRATAAAIFPGKKGSNPKLSENRKGSIFELFQLLSSLVRRW